MQSLPSAGRRRVYGTVGIVLVVAIVTLGLASYEQKFTPAVMVTLEADRSGLLTEPGGDVRVHGVPVGEIRSIAPEGDTGARLSLALDPGAVHLIPGDATATITPNTVFGPKSVLLDVPDGPVAQPIEAGDVLRTKQVATEVNDVFAALQNVLTAVQPAKLNATLGAMAHALDGRGSQLGDYVGQLNSYLDKLNPSLPALQKDLTSSANVLDTYSKVAPDLLQLADNASVTSKTLTQTQAGLHAVLLDFTRTAANGQNFLDQAGEPLMEAVSALEPTTALLAEYAPEFTCTIDGLNEARKRINLVMGNQLPAIQGSVSFKPGQQGYQYPGDLPKLITGLGPDCYQLPYLSNDEIPPKYIFDDGTKAYSSNQDTVSVGNPPAQFFSELFGPFAAQTLGNLGLPGVSGK